MTTREPRGRDPRGIPHVLVGAILAGWRRPGGRDRRRDRRTRRSGRTRLGALLAPALLLTVAACQDRPEPTEPSVEPAFTSVGDVSRDSTPAQGAVAAVVPTFGGYFLDEAGAPTVLLGDASYRPEAEDALAAFLAGRGFTAEDLVVREARYDYTQLDAWYRDAWPEALAVEGAVYSDLDEASNVLRFGAVDAGAVSEIESAVAALGVPAAAVVVEETAPIERVATLRDRVRPVHGGYQINFWPTDATVVSLVCTMGFNVVKNGVSSFITNSHCTNVQGGTETPTDYYQPLRDPDGDGLVNPENFIAVEVEDPHYDMVDCEIPGFRCRYSDASRAEYAAGVPFELGRIARTVARDRAIGTLEVDASSPTFRIHSEQERSVVGEEANKVGRTTGWTYGPVIETCINTIVLATNIIQRCQDRVQAGVDGGDSGSPVFRRLGNSSNVKLLGILWGSSEQDGEITYVFSPMHGIHRELGDFETS